MLFKAPGDPHIDVIGDSALMTCRLTGPGSALSLRARVEADRRLSGRACRTQ